MGALIDKIPLVIRITVCMPAAILVGLIVLAWIGILAGIITPETLPPYVSTELEPEELISGELEQ